MFKYLAGAPTFILVEKWVGPLRQKIVSNGDGVAGQDGEES